MNEGPSSAERPAPLNISVDLRDAARRDPEKTALIDAKGKHSYADVIRRADQIASGLFKLGIRRGDRVAFAIGNSLDFVAVFYGTLFVEAIAVPLPASWMASGFRSFLSAIAPRVIVAEEGAAGEVMAAGPHSAPVFVLGKHPTARPFADLLGEAVPHAPASGGPDPALIAHTSRGIGPPKGAVLSHRSLRAAIDGILDIEDSIDRSDVVLGVLPLHQIYGLNVVLLPSMRTGATVLLEDHLLPRESLAAASSLKATIIAGVPSMYRTLLEAPMSFDLSSVRFAVSGGARLDPDVIEGFRRRFGIEIWEGYGLTETGSVVATTKVAEQRPGSVGKPLEGFEIRIVDAKGEEALPGDPGEVWVRGPSLFSGYWGDEQATSDVFSGDWLMTGDVGFRDEDGFLWLVDREADVISISGFSVYPREVEEALLAHPAVDDAAVIGARDPRQGQRIKAFVVLSQGMTAGKEQLIVHCTKLLARFKVPSEIEVVRELPRSDAGLILRHKLRSESEG